MTKKVSTTMLMPAYATRFACIGGDCEDTCCAGWNITIDKESFLHYQACFDKVLRPRFNQYLIRNPKPESPAHYGHMALTQDACQSCGMLSDQKLCLIQERLGEKALSDTCTYYPRIIRNAGEGFHQMAMVLSCPVSARLALLDKNAFEFIGQDQSVSEGVVKTMSPRSGLSLDLMNEVWASLFQILRCEDLPLLHRLRVLGLFCQRLAESIENNRPAEVPALLADLDQRFQDGSIVDIVSGTPEHLEAQAQFVSVFFLARQKSMQTPHQRRVFDDVARGLGMRVGEPLDGAALTRAYAEGLERLAPALGKVPWLLEHYLLNEALIEWFPWGMDSPRAHFAAQVIRFATARLMLAGRAMASETQLTPEELAETIQVYCRLYLHSNTFSLHANKALAVMGWDRPEKLFNLL